MNTIVWVHGDNLNPNNPALLEGKNAPALFVWDEKLLVDSHISLKRITFIYECLLELPVTIRKGDVAEEIIKFAREHDATRILTAESPSPRFRDICKNVIGQMPKGSRLEVCKIQPFVTSQGQIDLKRFSRYWEKVKVRAMRLK
jgi:K+-sensing histidine kinase KdpD